MRTLVPILFILFVQCMSIFGQEDKTEILPEDLSGEWLRIVEVPSDIRGLYKKDSVIYRIGIDRIIDSVPYNSYDMMAFNARGKYEVNSMYGFIYRPWDRYGKNEFDYDLNVAFIKFNLRIRKDGAYVEREVRFSYTRDFSKDTVDVIIESEKFGLKRKDL